jgi:curved DNA-binding protein CbpA
VSETASDDDIRKAYKKLALKWHPDKHQDEQKPIAEEKFKKISEAYSILSDPAKKKEYEDSKRFGSMGSGTGGYTFNFNRSGGRGFDPFDIFKEFFGRGDPFFDDDDDIFNRHRQFSKGGGFGGINHHFKSGFGGFNDDDDFFKMGTGGGAFKFSSTSSSNVGGGGVGSGVKTSIKKTTQVL